MIKDAIFRKIPLTLYFIIISATIIKFGVKDAMSKRFKWRVVQEGPSNIQFD